MQINILFGYLSKIFTLKQFYLKNKITFIVTIEMLCIKQKNSIVLKSIHV